MNLRNRSFFLFLAVLLVFSVQYLFGTASVPFHPDETTYIFMSVELKPLFSTPSRLFWRAGSNDGLQWFRLLNPPLLHYMIEVGRTAAGLQALQEDWNWAKSWEENERRGRIPSPQLLLAARLSIAVWFPLSLVLFFLLTRRVAGEPAAWISVLLLGLNSLILLHTRRAMAEGILIFTLCLALWSILYLEKHPWLSAVPIGLAFCAKQSLVPLAFLGLLAVFWQASRKRNGWTITRQAFFYGVCFTLVVYLLNPVAWQHPVRTIEEAVRLRQYLVDIQLNGFPMHALETPAEKLSSLVYHLYFAPPMFAEASFHQAHIQASINAYLANPFHGLFRSTVWGSLLLALTLIGLIAGVYRIFHSDPVTRRRISLLLLATFLQAAILLVMIPLAWQRYYLPLIPYICLWAGIGGYEIIALAASATTKRPQPAPPVLR